MPGSLKTEAIVLRSMRYGEADRILHLFTPDRGRLSAIAKGVRRAKSRFGGRLEPYFRLQLVLYQGRSDLLTVTARRPSHGHPRLREHGGGARRRGARLRRGRAHVRRPRPAPRRLPPARQPARADRRRPGARHAAATRSRSGSSCCSPPASPRSCRRARTAARASTSSGSPARRAAWSAAACEASAFALGQDAHDFLVAALGRPLAEAPDAPPRALAQAERAILETLEHHANLRLRPGEASPVSPSMMLGITSERLDDSRRSAGARGRAARVRMRM